MGPGPKRQLLLGSKRSTRKSAFRSTVLVMSCHLIMYVCVLKILVHFFFFLKFFGPHKIYQLWFVLLRSIYSDIDDSKNTLIYLTFLQTQKKKSLLHFRFLALCKNFNWQRHFSEGISLARFTGQVPMKCNLHLLLFQSIKLYNRQMKKSQVPWPILYH